MAPNIRIYGIQNFAYQIIPNFKLPLNAEYHQHLTNLLYLSLSSTSVVKVPGKKELISPHQILVKRD